MKYKTRSIEVEAEQWNPQDILQTARLQISSYFLPIGEGKTQLNGSLTGRINGFHERIFIRPGEWVVVDANANSRVVMTHDEFQLKFESIE